MRQILPFLLKWLAFGLVDASTFFLSKPKMRQLSRKVLPSTPAPAPVAAPNPTAPQATVTQFKTKKGTDKRRQFGSGYTDENQSLGSGL